MTRADTKPLTGLLIADYSRILAGPLCTQLLADAGARVIKVEERGRGDETRRWGPPFVAGESAYFLSINRGKESITLDLKHAAAREISTRLIRIADVVVQNFRGEQQQRFGLDAESVRDINPRAVHCTIRGYDRDSVDADLPGYDLLAQASAGLMAITGPADGDPAKVGVALSDVLTAHYAHGGILAALLARERGQDVQAVEISIIGATEASLVNVAQSFLMTGSEPRRYGNEHPSIVPYQVFRGSDRAFALAVASDQHFRLLCSDVLGVPELGDDLRFDTNARRVEHRVPLVARLRELFEERPADGWIESCRRVGIPAALVRNFSEIFDASVLVERLEHPTAGEVPVVGSPLRSGGHRHTSPVPPPLLGQHSLAILLELGFTEQEIVAMQQDGVV